MPASKIQKRRAKFRRAKAFSLRFAGHSFQGIADQLGMSKAGAHKAYEAGLAEDIMRHRNERIHQHMAAFEFVGEKDRLLAFIDVVGSEYGLTVDEIRDQLAASYVRS